MIGIPDSLPSPLNVKVGYAHTTSANSATISQIVLEGLFTEVQSLLYYEILR